MYALVADVAKYPEFLPWCVGAVVHEQNDSTLEASLSMQRSGVGKSFRTRNDLRPGKGMTMTLVDGPFRHLVGDWSFQQLGEDGCKVQLELEFQLKSRALDAVFGRYLEDACNSMIESFTERARALYG